MMTNLKEEVTGGESSQRDVEDGFLQHISRDIVWATVVGSPSAGFSLRLL